MPLARPDKHPAITFNPQGVRTMKKIQIVKIQKLKTTATALYPIWMCWP
jgi:hypothetical protein